MQLARRLGTRATSYYCFSASAVSPSGVAGDRGFTTSGDVSQHLRSRCRQTWVEIDLDAAEHNAATLRHVGGTRGMIAVVKADAYGHGALHVAHAAMRSGAATLAVATLEEALSIRLNKQMPPKVPLLLLGATSRGSEDTILAHNIMPTLVSTSCLERFALAAHRLRDSLAHSPAKAHVKIDTGMGRVGVPAHQADELVALWRANPAWHSVLQLSGIYTHMAKADELDKAYTRMQLERFTPVARSFAAVSATAPELHVANSATVNDMHLILDDTSPRHNNTNDDNGDANLTPELSYVRPGISLYGLYASDEVDKERLPLRPLLTWKSRIVQLKELPPGEGISYGALFRTYRQPFTRVATIPVGYADGYHRRLGATTPQPPSALHDAWHVLVRGRRAPILGRVCMDMFMVDVSDIPGSQVDDEVVLLGRQGDQELSCDHWATRLGTINYEVTCAVGKRVPRLYLRRGKPVAISDINTSLQEDSYAEMLNATAAATARRFDST